MTAVEKMMMSVPEMVELLTNRANENTCDGESCDKEPPHTGCEGCRAANALNDACELLRAAI